jgi:putative transposase
MPKRRFTEEQVSKLLREAELTGGHVRELCRKDGLAEQTFYRWRQKYGGLEVAEAARLRQLEREHARLQKLGAERDLAVAVMMEFLANKWEARGDGGNRCRPCTTEGCPLVGPASCSQWRVQLWAISPGVIHAIRHGWR